MSIYPHNFSIYLITNIINGKHYVGKTVDVKTRFHKHVYDANSGIIKTKLYNSMRKNGVENFKFEVIFNTFKETDLNEFEIYFIKEYDCCVLGGNDKGYNMTRGGDGIDSETARILAVDRVKSGTHHWQGERGSIHNSKQNKIRIANGTHTFLGAKIVKDRIANGTFHMQGDAGRLLVKKRLDAGTHNFQGCVGREMARKNIMNGTHPSTIKWTCPKCGKEGYGMFNANRWHFDNCKLYSSYKASITKVSINKAPKWTITHPCGRVEEIIDLKKFCKDHNLHDSCMNLVASGKQRKHKGFICSRIMK
jgi:group I intron endonuclease